MENEKCYCGRDLHYSDPTIQANVEEMIKELGTHVNVICMNKNYSVPRHFIALHGLNACDLDSLGFGV